MITTMLRWKTSTAREKTTTQMIIWPFLCGDLFSRACTWLFPHRFEWTQTQKCIHVFESTKYDAPISPWYPIRIGFSCRSSDSFVEFGNRPTPSGIQKPSIQVITLLAPIERFMVLIEKMIRIMCECVIPLHGYKYSVSRSENLQIKTPNMVFSCSSLYGFNRIMMQINYNIFSAYFSTVLIAIPLFSHTITHAFFFAFAYLQTVAIRVNKYR